jgi:hypothetical protein
VVTGHDTDIAVPSAPVNALLTALSDCGGTSCALYVRCPWAARCWCWKKTLTPNLQLPTPKERRWFEDWEFGNRSCGS